MQKKCWNGSRRCLELRIRAMLAKLTDRVEQLLITFCFNEKSGSFTFFLFQFCFQEKILLETHIFMNIISRNSHIHIIYIYYIHNIFSSATVTAGPPGALVGIVEAWRRGFRWIRCFNRWRFVKCRYEWNFNRTLMQFSQSPLVSSCTLDDSCSFVVFLWHFVIQKSHISQGFTWWHLHAFMLCLSQSAKSPDILSLDLTNAFKDNEATAISVQSLVALKWGIVSLHTSWTKNALVQAERRSASWA